MKAEFAETARWQFLADHLRRGEKNAACDETNAIARRRCRCMPLVEKTDGLAIHCTTASRSSREWGRVSAALLTGMLGANALLGEPLARQDILSLATRERRPPGQRVPAMLAG